MIQHNKIIKEAKRKFQRFSHDPLGSIICRSKYLIFLISAKMNLSNDSYIKDFHNKRPENAISPDFCDLWILYKTVRSRKPNLILEFGSGYSTIVMASALIENYQENSNSSGFLYSLDADQIWANHTKEAIPNQLKNFLEVIYSPVTEIDYNGTKVF